MKISERSRRILIVLAVLLIAGCCWIPVIQSTANEQVDSGMKRALISFASARLLNAGISLVQGTAVSFQPLGVGLTLTVGQVLDPVNDLVEQFSFLMLMASVSFGVQKALLAIGGSQLVSIAVSGVAILWGVAQYFKMPRPWLSKLFLILVVIRFAVPAVTIGSDAIFQQLMAKEYNEQQNHIELTTKSLRDAAPNEVPVNDDRGWWEKLKDKVAASVPGSSLHIDAVKKSVEGLPERIIKLIVIFLMQTLVLPIGLLWILVSLTRALMRRPELLFSDISIKDLRERLAG